MNVLQILGQSWRKERSRYVVLLGCHYLHRTNNIHCSWYAYLRLDKRSLILKPCPCIFEMIWKECMAILKAPFQSLLVLCSKFISPFQSLLSKENQLIWLLSFKCCWTISRKEFFFQNIFSSHKLFPSFQNDGEKLMQC